MAMRECVNCESDIEFGEEHYIDGDVFCKKCAEEEKYLKDNAIYMPSIPKAPTVQDGGIKLPEKTFDK